MYGQAYGQAPPMGLPMDAAAGAGMPGHPGFPCIKLRGLPYDVVEDDVPGFLVRAPPPLGALSIDVSRAPALQRTPLTRLRAPC